MVEIGVNLITVPTAVPTVGTVASPLPFNFDNSGLLASGLTGGLDNSDADVILQLSSTGAPTESIYNVDNGGFYSGATATGTVLLPEGTSIRLKHIGPAFTWKVPAVVIAP